MVVRAALELMQRMRCSEAGQCQNVNIVGRPMQIPCFRIGQHHAGSSGGSELVWFSKACCDQFQA
jgi:hypothetical protein